jgi:DNA-binding LacI/PurR family transcriptional regulator
LNDSSAADSGYHFHNRHIAGFDDLALSPLLAPPLTTVHQPGFQKGRHAAALAVGLLNGRTSPSITLPFQVRVRGSTAPAPE